MIHDRPRIDPKDVRALLWLLVTGAIIVAICSVPPEWLQAAQP